jgi:hypothetical protein
VSSKTLLSAPEVHTTLRAGVGRRTRISKTAKEAMILFARAGMVVAVVLHVKGRGSADAPQAAVVTLTIYWTVVAVTLIWMIDVFVRALRGHFDKGLQPRFSRAIVRGPEGPAKLRCVPLREHAWRQREWL